jgi:hypothetical protein
MPEQRDIACRVILNLMQVVKADFIALGEMSDVDLSYIAETCGQLGYSFRAETTKAGRSRFDVCYIYNDKKIVVLNSKDIVSAKGDTTLKVAKRVDIGILEDGAVFHVFISHWPSRLWCERHNANRHTFGVRLRDAFEDVLSSNDPKPYVILLGDYNDEPFDESLSEQVMATRDIDLVRKTKHLLYNPFWKHLSKQSTDHHGAGSYFYKKGQLTKWHTFDQLMFSQAFVVSDNWVYNDSCDLILEIPELISMVNKPKNIFDHLPVYGIVEKVSNNG